MATRRRLARLHRPRRRRGNARHQLIDLLSRRQTDRQTSRYIQLCACNTAWSLPNPVCLVQSSRPAVSAAVRLTQTRSQALITPRTITRTLFTIDCSSSQPATHTHSAAARQHTSSAVVPNSYRQTSSLFSVFVSFCFWHTRTTQHAPFTSRSGLLYLQL